MRVKLRCFILSTEKWLRGSAGLNNANSLNSFAIRKTKATPLVSMITASPHHKLINISSSTSRASSSQVLYPSQKRILLPRKPSDGGPRWPLQVPHLDIHFTARGDRQCEMDGQDSMGGALLSNGGGGEGEGNSIGTINALAWGKAKPCKARLRAISNLIVYISELWLNIGWSR